MKRVHQGVRMVIEKAAPSNPESVLAARVTPRMKVLAGNCELFWRRSADDEWQKFDGVVQNLSITPEKD